MALPRPIVFGNWKMHGLRAEAIPLADALKGGVGRESGRGGTLGVFPPATVLRDVADRLNGTGILVGGQDCHERARGAFTGCVSAAMLKDSGATGVLVGHSERRHGLGEGDELVRAKAEAALAEGLLVTLCIGETEEEWLAGRTLEVLDRQLRGSWPAGAAPDRVVVAYEPVWAIGTGRTPEVSDIERAHAAIRERLGELSSSGGGEVPVLYGGSVKPDNAARIMAVPGVGGVLVGGACLDAEGFLTIHRAGAAA